MRGPECEPLFSTTSCRAIMHICLIFQRVKVPSCATAFWLYELRMSATANATCTAGQKNCRVFIGAFVRAPTAVLRFNIIIADVGSDGESGCIPCSTSLKTSIIQARPAGVDDGWEGAARYQWADWPPGCGVQHQRIARGAIVVNIVSESVFFRQTTDA